jgi:hypothetical protein
MRSGTQVLALQPNLWEAGRDPWSRHRRTYLFIYNCLLFHHNLASDLHGMTVQVRRIFNGMGSKE